MVERKAEERLGMTSETYFYFHTREFYGRGLDEYWVTPINFSGNIFSLKGPCGMWPAFRDAIYKSETITIGVLLYRLTNILYICPVLSIIGLCP
jgi:hypothetical protein